jgi:alpha-galactosidase
MADGCVAVVLLNRGTATTTISTSASVPSHGVSMYIVSRGGSTPTTSPPTTTPSTTPAVGTCRVNAVVNAWNTGLTEQITITNTGTAAVNGSVAPNSSVSIGFQATHTGNATGPGSFSLNGSACTLT